MFSNCPPNQLATFLKCLSLKLAQSKQNGIASNRRRLLSDETRSFENISPLTDKDFTVGCKKRPLEDKDGVTPKRIKGKESDSNCGNDEHSGPARRLLSSLSSFQMNLIPEQMVVINAIRAGNSVFFTGSAGTGKSYLLKRLITMLPPQSTFITASTGAAACHIGGTTLHVCARVCVCVCVVCELRVASIESTLLLYRTFQRILVIHLLLYDFRLLLCRKMHLKAGLIHFHFPLLSHTRVLS